MNDPTNPPAGSLEAAVASLGAAMAVSQYIGAALIIAAAERGAIDPERVFVMLRLLAEGFEAGKGRYPETGRIAAHALRDVEVIYKNLLTIPAGAGRA